MNIANKQQYSPEITNYGEYCQLKAEISAQEQLDFLNRDTSYTKFDSRDIQQPE